MLWYNINYSWHYILILTTFYYIALLFWTSVNICAHSCTCTISNVRNQNFKFIVSFAVTGWIIAAKLEPSSITSSCSNPVTSSSASQDVNFRMRAAADRGGMHLMPRAAEDDGNLILLPVAQTPGSTVFTLDYRIFDANGNGRRLCAFDRNKTRERLDRAFILIYSPWAYMTTWRVFQWKLSTMTDEPCII